MFLGRPTYRMKAQSLAQVASHLFLFAEVHSFDPLRRSHTILTHIPLGIISIILLFKAIVSS